MQSCLYFYPVMIRASLNSLRTSMAFPSLFSDSWQVLCQYTLQQKQTTAVEFSHFLRVNDVLPYVEIAASVKL